MMIDKLSMKDLLCLLNLVRPENIKQHCGGLNTRQYKILLSLFLSKDGLTNDVLIGAEGCAQKTIDLDLRQLKKERLITDLYPKAKNEDKKFVITRKGSSKLNEYTKDLLSSGKEKINLAITMNFLCP